MKAIKLIITLLIIIQVSSQAEEKRTPSPSVIKMKFSPISQKDTAANNAFVRKGTKYLSSKENNLEMTDGATIPVSRNRKDLFLAHMAKFKG